MNALLFLVLKGKLQWAFLCLLLYMHKGTYNFWGIYQGMEYLSLGTHISRFIGNVTVAKIFISIYTPTSLLLAPRPWQHLVPSVLKFFASPVSVTWYFIVGFVRFPWLLKVESLFITLWTICVSPSVKMLVCVFCLVVY